MKIVLDIDGVIRDIRDKVREMSYIYFRGTREDFNDYPKDKLNIEFFTWLKSTPYFNNVFDNPKTNYNLLELLDELMYSGEIHVNDIHLLSCNSCSIARTKTREYIQQKTNILDRNIHFVDRAKMKSEYLIEHFNKSGVIFVDDRLDTILDTKGKEIKSFWYTKYVNENVVDMWFDDFGRPVDIMYGGTSDLKHYIRRFLK